MKWVRRGLATLAVAMLLPSAAAATTITGENLSRPYQAWANAAYVATPSRSVQIVEQLHEIPCTHDGVTGRFAGCTDGEAIWLDPGLPGREARNVFLHELGHIYAAEVGRPVTDERFADAYAFCATHRRNRPWFPTYLRRTCRQLRAVAISIRPTGSRPAV